MSVYRKLKKKEEDEKSSFVTHSLGVCLRQDFLTYNERRKKRWEDVVDSQRHISISLDE